MKFKFPGMDFEKEGSGVWNQNGFSRFFSILKRKFFYLVRLNLLQVLASLPAFALSAAVTYLLFPINTADADNDLAGRIFAAFLMTALQFITAGPLQAGFIYVLKNIAAEKEVFVLHDFWHGVRSNLKQSFAISAADISVCGILCLMFSFYSRNPSVAGSIMSNIFIASLALFALVYAMMHIYIFPMVVSADLTVKQIFSNALRFAAARFIPNLGILAAALAFAVLIFINAIAGIFIILFAGYALTGFLETFFAYGAIEKYVVNIKKPNRNLI